MSNNRLQIGTCNLQTTNQKFGWATTTFILAHFDGHENACLHSATRGGDGDTSTLYPFLAPCNGESTQQFSLNSAGLLYIESENKAIQSNSEIGKRMI